MTKPLLIETLNLYFESLQRSRTTRVVVLKGAGSAFCAGLDFKHAMGRRAHLVERLYADPPGEDVIVLR